MTLETVFFNMNFRFFQTNNFSQVIQFRVDYVCML